MNTAVLFSSATGDHLTPKWLLGKIADFMSGIDLDPCASAQDPGNVPAAMVYTEAEDGLSRPWRGRVFINPPYGRVIGTWVEKAEDEWAAGHMAEGIMLLPARVDTRWWSALRDRPVCFVRGRLRFGDADYSAPFPSALVYYGERPAAFAEWAGELGIVYLPSSILEFASENVAEEGEPRQAALSG